MSERGPSTIYRFGIFEADPISGELRRKGLRIRLHAQPFQALLLLLERPGETVTRDEIARRLWPDGTFVDYEHGVNSAMNRLRDALGDKASNPRFIETLAKRGYRFIASVEECADPPATLPSEWTPGVQEQVTSRVLTSSEDLPRSSPQLVQTFFILFQLMYLSFYIGALVNLAEIQELIAPLPHAQLILRVLILSAVLLIPVRTFLLCATLFRPPHFLQRFLRLWWLSLSGDLLWTLSPFLLLHHINEGLALACMSFLVYSPFAQRSLVLMGAGQIRE